MPPLPDDTILDPSGEYATDVMPALRNMSVSVCAFFLLALSSRVPVEGGFS